jgi:hypothetical protein
MSMLPIYKVEGDGTNIPPPKATPINVSQSPTLYYLEPPMKKECLGPWSDEISAINGATAYWPSLPL